MYPSRNLTPSPTLDNLADSLDDIPIPYQLFPATEISKENNIWPFHRYASLFFSALVVGYWTFLIAAIVGIIIPEAPDVADKSLGRRSSQKTGTTTLSWPSACWALVAIGINTMCQPFGRVLGFPNQHSFALRSSPLICMVDTLAMLLDVVRYGIQTRSVFEGVSLTVQARFVDVQADEDGSFGALRKNTIFRALLFFLGALPQAIKLYAVSGVPWTQALATIYLASFLISEVAAAIARRHRVEQVPINQSSSRYTKYWGLAMLIVLAVSHGFADVLLTAAIFVIVQNYWTLAAWPLILCACLLNILYFCSIVFSKSETLILCSGPIVPLSGLSLSVAVPSIAVRSFGLQPTPWLLFADRESVALLSAVSTVAIIGIAFTSVSFYKLTKNVSSKNASYMHFQLSSYYFLLHLIAAFLVFGILYDPMSTIKPTWTDALG